MKCLAIIPARSGSKGIKNKNIKLLNGKPLMAYTIECALKSKIFSDVMVSTDSSKYAKIAKKYGASVPFLRSEINSIDKEKTVDAIKEVLSNYDSKGIKIDAFCILQPTSPLRNVLDLKKAYKIFVYKAKVAVVSVCEMEHNPMFCNTLNNESSLDGFIKQNFNNKRRQDLKKYYRVNGAIYFCYVKEFLKDDNFYRKGSYAYLMPKERSIDIDDEFDFKIAEALINN